jgi:hypothetical protein
MTNTLFIVPTLDKFFPRRGARVFSFFICILFSLLMPAHAEDTDIQLLLEGSGSDSARLSCSIKEQSLQLQTAPSWYDQTPTAPSWLLLMPSEQVFEVIADVRHHDGERFSFNVTLPYVPTFVQSLGSTEMVVLSGINGFEGEGVVLDPVKVKEFLSKCLADKK